MALSSLMELILKHRSLLPDDYEDNTKQAYIREKPLIGKTIGSWKYTKSESIRKRKSASGIYYNIDLIAIQFCLVITKQNVIIFLTLVLKWIYFQSYGKLKKQ